MRLWHEDLLNVLPAKQLLSQHRECCALRGKGWGRPHSTVDYVFTYPKERLVFYHWRLMLELENRGYVPDVVWYNPGYQGKKLPTLINVVIGADSIKRPVYPEHDKLYLIECLKNLIAKLTIKFDKYLKLYTASDKRTVQAYLDRTRLIEILNKNT